MCEYMHSRNYLKTRDLTYQETGISILPVPDLSALFLIM